MVAGEVAAVEAARDGVSSGTEDKDERDGGIPITKSLLAILEMRKHAPDGTEHGSPRTCFGNEVGEPRKDFQNQWGRVCTTAKIEGLHFHDLRREFASRLLESGCRAAPRNQRVVDMPIFKPRLSISASRAPV